MIFVFKLERFQDFVCVFRRNEINKKFVHIHDVCNKNVEITDIVVMKLTCKVEKGDCRVTRVVQSEIMYSRNEFNLVFDQLKCAISAKGDPLQNLS